MSRAVAGLTAALALMLAACGSAPAAGAATSSGSPSQPAPATASPSPAPSPALTFKLSGVNGAKAAGSITLSQTSTTMTLELTVAGLSPDSAHVSHVHTGSCQKPGGILFALNQVIADGTGAADARTTVQAHYPPASGHWYVVVHAGPDMQGTNASYLLCGNLF